ncbi:MAG: HD domain-containing phosphohydrolase [Desulfosarcinaceae bacterium]|nr:HD domain-containing phosphohydrolase [Desulfosarcinaceae bacterium]
MPDYIPIRKSQALHYMAAPLFIKNAADEFILYKTENAEMDMARFQSDRCPQLYIPNEHRAALYAELQRSYHILLAKRMKAGDIQGVKAAICDIVQEALQEPLGHNLQTLPETIDIVYRGYASTTELLKHISGFRYGGTTLVEHVVNTLLLILNYCIFHGLRETETKALTLGALLHDVGLSRIPERIIQSDDRLSKLDFKIYTTHPVLGHEIIRAHMTVDAAVAMMALEHHEELDGSGYPHGQRDLSFGGRLLGIVDTFEQLTFNEKTHRQRREPFGALKLIQDEMLREGNYDKEIFRGLCLSLVGKSRFA